MKRTRILSLLLSAALLLSLSACVAKVETGENKDDEGPAVPEHVVTEPVATEQAQSGYTLPAGAASEQELYETVLAYLNGGFRYADLGDIYDPILATVYYVKSAEDPEENVLPGLTAEESCALAARLAEKLAALDPPVDEYGELETDRLDYDALLAEFPELLRAQIDADSYGLEQFCEMLYYGFEIQDGENPFHTGQTVWEPLPEPETAPYEAEAQSGDLSAAFPKLYIMQLGSYIEENQATEMELLYTRLDGRYYMLSFIGTFGVVGG